MSPGRALSRLIALMLLLGTVGHAAAQIPCTQQLQGSVACFSAASGLKLTDLLSGMQATGPLRSPQSVSVTPQQLLNLFKGTVSTWTAAQTFGSVTVSGTTVAVPSNSNLILNAPGTGQVNIGTTGLGLMSVGKLIWAFNEPLGSSFIATGSGTNLTTSSVNGTIVAGLVTANSGAGIPANTHILSQTSGPIGGAGVYVTDNATTISGAGASGAATIDKAVLNMQVALHGNAAGSNMLNWGVLSDDANTTGQLNDNFFVHNFGGGKGTFNGGRGNITTFMNQVGPVFTGPDILQGIQNSITLTDTFGGTGPITTVSYTNGGTAGTAGPMNPYMVFRCTSRHPGSSFIGSGSGTNLTARAVYGLIEPGPIAGQSGGGVPVGTNILSQSSGPTGGAGVYVTDNATTSTNERIAGQTFVSPCYAFGGGGTGGGEVDIQPETGAVFHNFNGFLLTHINGGSTGYAHEDTGIQFHDALPATNTSHFDRLIGVGDRTHGFPLYSSTGEILQIQLGQYNSSAANFLNGVNFLLGSPSGNAFMSQNFAVDGPTGTVWTTACDFGGTTTGAAVDCPGSTGVATLTSGGTNWPTDGLDYYATDSNNGVWTLTINGATGVVTGISQYRTPIFRGGGSPPATETLTPDVEATLWGATGLTVSLVWTANATLGLGNTSATAINLGNSGSTTTIAGTIKAGASTGLSCSGTPTSSFASVNGIVTHC